MSKVTKSRNIDKTPLVITGENVKKKTLHLYFEERGYSELLSHSQFFREHLDMLMEVHPELFPDDMVKNSYDMHDIRYSSRQDLSYRRIRVRGEESRVLTVLPSFVMPYWTEKTDKAGKALLLRYTGTSYDTISYVLGGSAVHWERVETHLGRCNIVQTTLVEPGELPSHYAADEKITFFNGKEASVPMTCAEECVWGIDLCLTENIEGLQTGYGAFATEAKTMNADFEPKSVVIDGWPATRSAWKTLFPTATLILCFLHGVLKIGDRAKHLKEQWATIRLMLWDAYKAADAETFKAKMDLFKVIATAVVEPFEKKNILEAIQKVWSKKDEYAKGFEFDNSYRTSNQVDRPMKALDRYLYNTQYFHGNLENAQLKLRAWALIHNFKPFCQRTNLIHVSRFHQLNRVIYHDHWLQNLLIAGKKSAFIHPT